MIKNKNNQLYIFSLAFFFTHFFFLLYGHNIIRISGNDTLIACLLGIIIDVFLFTITKNIIYKKINPSYLLIPVIIIFTIILLKDTAIFINRNFLRECNIFYLIILLILTSLLISKRELDQIAHLAFISLIIFIILFVIQISGATHSLDIAYLSISFNSTSIIKGALLFSSYTYLPFLLFSIFATDKTKKMRKAYLLGFLFSLLIIILEYFLIALLPSLLLSKYYDYPYMLVMNKISSFLIFNRFYAIFNIFLILDQTIVLACLFSFLKGFIVRIKSSIRISN